MTEEYTRSITCDSCNKELIQETNYPAVYSLELRGINTNINNSGMTFAVHVEPPKTAHFCGKACLKEWLK